MGALKDSGSFASSIGSAFSTCGSGTATNLDKAAVAVGAAGAGPYAAGGLWQKTSFSGVGDMKSFIENSFLNAEPRKLVTALWAIPSWPALGSHATCSETPPAG